LTVIFNGPGWFKIKGKGKNYFCLAVWAGFAAYSTSKMCTFNVKYLIP